MNAKYSKTVLLKCLKQSCHMEKKMKGREVLIDMFRF